MGDAKKRGTAEERREQALETMLDNAEVLIALGEKDGGINLQVLPRDAAPNGQSLAVILAAFIDSNLVALMKAAVQAKLHSEQTPAANEIAMKPVRSILTADGNVAKVDVGAIAGPDGRPLQ